MTNEGKLESEQGKQSLYTRTWGQNKKTREIMSQNWVRIKQMGVSILEKEARLQNTIIMLLKHKVSMQNNYAQEPGKRKI